ncbi:hypothetical protein [Ferrimicrobium sp.]|uniref:hypothetical protein n=1 Tax=Ferrimicrobium sp. TaxID=2926050 RepID=UPI00262E895D|nr:hypothetical protein [Ferrimicrobium sp.]
MEEGKIDGSPEAKAPDSESGLATPKGDGGGADEPVIVIEVIDIDGICGVY